MVQYGRKPLPLAAAFVFFWSHSPASVRKHIRYLELWQVVIPFVLAYGSWCGFLPDLQVRLQVIQRRRARHKLGYWHCHPPWWDLFTPDQYKMQLLSSFISLSLFPLSKTCFFLGLHHTLFFFSSRCGALQNYCVGNWIIAPNVSDKMLIKKT